MKRKLTAIKIRNLLCLLIPIIMAFIGYFVAVYLLKNTQVQQKINPELFKFLMSLLFFAVPVSIIFVFSRNVNYIVK